MHCRHPTWMQLSGYIVMCKTVAKQPLVYQFIRLQTAPELVGCFKNASIHSHALDLFQSRHYMAC
jgi:hypothetical protein